MLENIGLSFKGIWAHKMRSFLTMLGIIIGIASIITIVSTIKGSNEQIKQNLIGSGNNTVNIELFQDDWNYEMQYNGIPKGVPVISKKVLGEINRINGVEAAATYVFRNEYEGVYYGNTGLNGVTVTGIDDKYFDVCGYVAKRGRLFDSNDYTNFLKTAVIDTNSALGLFHGENPVGKTIDIKGEPFVVIGVVSQASKYEPVINTMEDYYTYNSDYSSGNIFIPYADWPIIYQYDEPQNVVIQAKNTDYMTKAGRETAQILNNYIETDMMNSEGAIQYKSKDLLEQATQIQQLSAAANQQLIWIAGISLIVGGIGVMNIMLVSVTERTREIGLKKALGARRRRILFQFLTEASVLTSIGGIIGVVCGIILAYIFSAATSAPVAISVPAIIVSVAFSMVIGILFGLIPSIKASKLNPIDALRYE
ncbi:MAG: ABC transporter permease [Lachnospiraceae bacterium]|nr:ABC transporter permease [Lachnospiraceae bacterium]